MDDKEKKFIIKILDNKNIDINALLQKEYKKVSNDTKNSAKAFLAKNKIGFQNIKQNKISITSFVIEQEVYFLEIFMDVDHLVYKKNNNIVTLNDYLIVAFIMYILKEE